jgi:hypothetical protein
MLLGNIDPNGNARNLPSDNEISICADVTAEQRNGGNDNYCWKST